MRGSGDHRQISCVLPHGLGTELQRRLFSELALTRVDVHPARGFIGADPAGLFNRVEKDYLSVVVSADRADEVFEWIHREGGVAELEGRFLYMTRLESATPYRLPEGVPEEDRPAD